MTKAPATEVGRALPDGQVQPFDIGSIQLARILRGAPHLVPPPCRTNPGFPLHPDDAILSSFLDDLAVQASHSEEAPDDLSIELEAIRRDQRKMTPFGLAAELSK